MSLNETDRNLIVARELQKAHEAYDDIGVLSIRQASASLRPLRRNMY